MTENTEEIEYITSTDGNLAILRALNEITFWRWMETLMPLVAKRLVEAGVDFSKVTEWPEMERKDEAAK